MLLVRGVNGTTLAGTIPAGGNGERLSTIEPIERDATIEPIERDATDFLPAAC